MDRRFVTLLRACTAICALAVLVLAVSTASRSSAETPDINTVAIDMDTTGNNTVSCAGQGCAPGTLGSIEACAAIDPDQTHDIDIVVDAVPGSQGVNGTGPNIQGYDMDLIYDPAVVKVAALPANASTAGPPGNLDINYAGTPGGPHSSGTDATPDTDGDFFISEIDFGTSGESGPGILMRVTLQGIVAGSSALRIKYTAASTDFPNIYDNSGSQSIYTIGANQGATIVVGGTCEGAPTAPPTTAATPTRPASSSDASATSQVTSTATKSPSSSAGPAPVSDGDSGSSSTLLIIGGVLATLCVLGGAAFLVTWRLRKL